MKEKLKRDDEGGYKMDDNEIDSIKNEDKRM